jgi:hypothetical protein
MGEIWRPERETYWVARSSDTAVLHHGSTSSIQVTTTGQPVLDATEDPNVHLTTLGAWADQFPVLPGFGAELSAGEHYRWGDGVVVVRQSHARTIHDPPDVPALFLVSREPGSDIEWMAGERVQVGTVRTYGGSSYRCLQAHVTQSDWTPPATPALWQLDEPLPPAGEWAANVNYKIDDEVMYQGTIYRCRQAHRSQVGWEPPAAPALWLEI